MRVTQLSWGEQMDWVRCLGNKCPGHADEYSHHYNIYSHVSQVAGINQEFEVSQKSAPMIGFGMSAMIKIQEKGRRRSRFNVSECLPYV